MRLRIHEAKPPFQRHWFSLPDLVWSTSMRPTMSIGKNRQNGRSRSADYPPTPSSPPSLGSASAC